MSDEKRMIENYEVMYVIQLGVGEVIFATDKAAKMPYLVCDCSWDNPFGVDEYKNAVAGDDPVEMMREFTNRLSARMDSIEDERNRRGIPHETLTAADCVPKGMESDIEGKVIVMKPEKLSPVFRSIDHQLALCTGGNGSRPQARGRAVFCTNLYTGKSSRWNRDDVAGTISVDRLSNWAREKLADLQKPTEKESVINKIRQSKENETQPKFTNKKHDKSGQEL